MIKRSKVILNVLYLFEAAFLRVLAVLSLITVVTILILLVIIVYKLKTFWGKTVLFCLGSYVPHWSLSATVKFGKFPLILSHL